MALPDYQLNDWYGTGSNVLGLASGIERGGTVGRVQAGTSAASLAARTGIFGEATKPIETGAADLTNLYGIYSGLERGGAQGYLGAGANTAQLLSRSGAFGAESGLIGAVAGDVAAGLALYNFAENWRSGATGSDALSGAAAGASIGSIVPGLGTLAGAVIGGAIGAASSMFGPGREDPENANWNSYAAAFDKYGAQGVAGATPSQNFQLLAGIFDARGSSIPFYQRYGRMGENRFMADMTATINHALAAGRISPTDTPQAIYQKVVGPWINAMSPTGQWQNTSTVQGAAEKNAAQNVITDLIGQYQAGQITGNTQLGISGQTVQGMQPFGALGEHVPAAVGGTPAVGHTPSMKEPVGRLTSGTAGTSMALTSQQPALSPTAAGTATTDPMTLAAMGATGTSAGGGTDPLLMTAGLTGIGLAGETLAQRQNTSTIAPIMAAGGTWEGAGTTLLSESMNNYLTPPQQQVLNTAQQQGTAMIQAATPVGQIAQQEFAQYKSGNLKPADQAQLDQKVTAEKAQIAQALGPNVDGTTLATYYAQIDQQALITKQQMLNSYFSTGNTAFDTWAQTTQQGQQTILKGQEYAVTQIDNTFSKALEAGTLGSQNILSGIELAMKSNEQLASSFGNYMSNLAKAYALSKFASGAGGGGGVPPAVSGSDLAGYNASAATDLNATTNQQIGVDQRQMLTDINFGQEPSLPQGSVSVGQPFDMSQINSSFANAPTADFGSAGAFGYY